MAVVILHSADELKLVKFQKELISDLFEEGRILIAARPLWINFSDDINSSSGFLAPPKFNSIELGDVDVSDTELFIPVTISTDAASYHSKLSLVILHSGRKFSDSDRKKLSQKKQPVNRLKIFRLGEEK